MIISTAGETMRRLFFAGCFGCFLGYPATVGAETATFNFAPIGTAFSAFLGPDSPLVGPGDHFSANLLGHRIIPRIGTSAARVLISPRIKAPLCDT